MFDTAVTVISMCIEIAGIAAMVIGFVMAGFWAISDHLKHASEDIYRDGRRRLGKAILLGLELLVAADILRTVTEIPSLEQIAVLAAIVGVRTFLSFTLEVELTGRLPWRHHEIA